MRNERKQRQAVSSILHLHRLKVEAHKLRRGQHKVNRGQAILGFAEGGPPAFLRSLQAE